MPSQKGNFQVAAKALLFSKGRYLLLQKSDTEEVAPLEWDIPGGRVRYGENPLDALKREVLEETGFKINPSRAVPFEIWSIKKPEFQLVGIDFLCVLGAAKKPRLGSEHLSAKWLKKAEILRNANIPKWLKNSVKNAESGILTRLTGNGNRL